MLDPFSYSFSINPIARIAHLSYFCKKPEKKLSISQKFIFSLNFFQASRNSLDGAGLSSASLGRKLNRPFSPSPSRKGLNPLRNSSSSPFVLEQFEKNPSQVIVTTSPEAEPVIETPLSPEREDHPSSFNFGGEFEFQNSCSNNVFVVDDNNVEIEDITDQDFSCEIETMIQDFDTVLKQSELDDIDDETLLTRPSHLNLSGSSPKKASYAFNSRIGKKYSANT